MSGSASSPLLPLLPAGEPADLPHIAVGGAVRPAALLTLTNDPGTETSAAFHADTLLESALLLLRSTEGRALLGQVQALSVDGCDGDRLLALWACREPDVALARSEAAVAAARASLFGRAASADAAQFACWVRATAQEQPDATPVALLGALLPDVTAALDRPRDFDLVWIGEYSDIIRAESMLHSGAVTIDEHPDLDLSVLQTPLDLHDITRFTATDGSRLLTVRTENTYIFEYRLESWLQLRSRRPLPRVALEPLATRLGWFERAPGTWRAEPVNMPRARLLLDRGDGRPGPSSLAAETVIAETLDYLTAAAGRPEALWSPYPAGGRG